MTVFAPRIEALRQWAVWECKDLTVNLVLAVIAHESGGIIGRPSGEKTPAYEVLNDAGQPETVNHAYGLMQCTPGLLKTWQASGKEPKITIDDLRKTDERAARCQIALGSWYLANQIRQLYQYDPASFPGANAGAATPEQIKLALCAYAAGWGANGNDPADKGLKPKLDWLKANGHPLTLEMIKKAFPTWGQRENGSWFIQPVLYAGSVFSNYLASGGSPLLKAAEQMPQPLAQPLAQPKSDWLKTYWPLLVLGGIVLISKMGLLKGILGNDKAN